MIKKIFHLAAVVLLMGCASPIRTPLPVKTAPVGETGAASSNPTKAIRTLVPAATAYPVTTQAPSEAPYPGPPTEPAAAETAYPAPQVAAVASPAIGPVIQATALPFHDCARTPGLAGCASDAIPLKARLAYIDSTPSRLVGLDLEDGHGWQLPLPSGDPANGLDWSLGGQDGPRLLIRLSDDRYQALSAEGDALEHGTSPAPLSWQPDGALGKDGAVHAENGDQAVLEHTPDSRWLLHVKTGQEEKSLPLDANPGDILYGLLGWAPGSQTLLAQSYFAGNQAMTQGGQLITIDANSGAIQTYPASMPISDTPAAYFAWDLTQSARLAFLESSETSVVAPRLALLDVQTGQLQFPLPEGLLLTGLAWNPDGRLAFTVGRVDGLTTPEAREDFSSPGIYLLDPQNGQTHSLVSTPPGAADTWPHWTADGQILVYARALTGQKERSMLQVRARRLSDGTEWVLVEGLPASGAATKPNFASRWLAFSVK